MATCVWILPLIGTLKRSKYHSGSGNKMFERFLSPTNFIVEVLS